MNNCPDVPWRVWTQRWAIKVPGACVGAGFTIIVFDLTPMELNPPHSKFEVR
ncbi:MAG: hypothetical protein RIE73_11230 [Coleofasciculus sp. C1-SOL-03]|jgi:hypothetical protein